MPATLKEVLEKGKAGDLIRIVQEHLLDGVSEDNKKSAVMSVQEAADESALVGPDMMRVVSTLQRNGWVKSGLYKELVQLDKDLSEDDRTKEEEAKPKAEKKTKKAAAPKEPPAPTNPIHPDKPELLKSHGYQFPVPDDKFWRRSAKAYPFHTALRAERLTRDQLVEKIVNVPDSRVDEKKLDQFIKEYEKGKWVDHGYLLVREDDGTMWIKALTVDEWREIKAK